MSASSQKERIAVYPGSFDPPTMGHLNIIDRGAEVFDRVVVGVAINTSKNGVFTREERVDLLEELVADRPNVEVDSFHGLLVDYMDEKGYTTVLRGIRTVSDFESELQMAQANRLLKEHIDTVFMMTDANYSHLSSSIIREIISLGGDTKGMVSPQVEAALKAKLAPKG